MCKFFIRYITTIVLSLATVLTTYGQESTERLIQNRLYELGFEDIRVILVADTLYASFEDPTYRGTFRGPATALSHLAAEHPEINDFRIEVTDQRMPQLAVRAFKREGIWDVSVDRQTRSIEDQLNGIKAEHPTAGHLDITPYPMISIINNKTDHLFDFSLRIAPAFGITLWRGARLTVQPIIPIAHMLDDGDSKRYIQTGCININQRIIATKRWDVQATAGTFIPQRIGLQAKAAFHATRTLDFYVDAGVTGTAGYDRRQGFGFSVPKRVNAFVGVDYYEPRTKLQFQLAAGQFLWGDRGARADLTRHFGEYAIGIYGVITGGERNAGFHFAIPFGPKKQRRKGFLRVRLPEYYSMEYTMTSWFKYYIQRMGETYNTRPDASRADNFYQPAYVEHYIKRCLNNAFPL